jgi:hypothetical protein
MLESEIQSKIIKKLESLNYYVVKIIISNKPGLLDLIIHRDGKTAYIEVKRPGEKPRDLQLYRMKQLQDHGIPTLTCTSVEECLLKLQSII